MPLDVIGAGFGRTGTLSLKYALEELGYGLCYHMLELRDHPEHIDHWSRALRGEPDWEALFGGYRAAVDWPACSYWRDYHRLYPEAKVILSLRDAGAWYESVTNTIYPSSVANCSSVDPATRARGEYQRELIWQSTFDGRFEDRDHAIATFNAHNDAVKATIPAGQLLAFEPGDGWTPLCEFLEVSTPVTPFPKTNSTAQFEGQWKSADSPTVG